MLLVYPAVRIERTPHPVEGVKPHYGLQALDRRDEVTQCVVPSSLFVAERRVVVLCVVLFAEFKPAPRGETQGVSVQVNGKG